MALDSQCSDAEVITSSCGVKCELCVRECPIRVQLKSSGVDKHRAQVVESSLDVCGFSLEFSAAHVKANWI